ncbi:hypothetical protein Tco_1085750 [Tanacetum coccineum]
MHHTMVVTSLHDVMMDGCRSASQKHFIVVIWDAMFFVLVFDVNKSVGCGSAYCYDAMLCKLSFFRKKSLIDNDLLAKWELYPVNLNLRQYCCSSWITVSSTRTTLTARRCTVLSPQDPVSDKMIVVENAFPFEGLGNPDLL